MRPTPLDPAFDAAYFRALTEEARRAGKRSVKGLLTQDQLIPGLGNSIAQDIMFRAGLHPRRSLDTLGEAQVDTLYHAITQTVQEVIAAGGRYDEHDLHDAPGGYVRIMDAGPPEGRVRPCGTPVAKISYLGGACYFCPSCQQ